MVGPLSFFEVEHCRGIVLDFEVIWLLSEVKLLDLDGSRLEMFVLAGSLLDFEIYDILFQDCLRGILLELFHLSNIPYLEALNRLLRAQLIAQ